MVNYCCIFPLLPTVNLLFQLLNHCVLQLQTKQRTHYKYLCNSFPNAVNFMTHIHVFILFNSFFDDLFSIVCVESSSNYAIASVI